MVSSVAGCKKGLLKSWLLKCQRLSDIGRGRILELFPLLRSLY